MKICIVGEGSIGKRYKAILKALEIQTVTYEIENDTHGDPIPEADKYLICTPTDTHMKYVRELIKQHKTFLCEKPVSKDLNDCESVASYDNGYVVCNYKFLIPRLDSVSLYYDYYHSGKEGIWDFAQIVYLDPNAVIKKDSTIWTFKVNGIRVPYDELEDSYRQMIEAFIFDEYTDLWDLRDGYEMTKRVLEREQREGTTRHSSKK